MRTKPGRRACALGLAAAVLTAPVALALPAAASPTRHELVYTFDADRDGLYAIVARDLESQNRPVRTIVPEDEVNGWTYDDPELSPNGALVAFSSDRGSTRFDEGIAVIASDGSGSGFRRLTNPPSGTETQPYSIDLGASWSPDGTRLLFTRVTSTPLTDGSDRITTALMTVPLAGGSPTAVVGAGNGYTGDWSPSGEEIVFAATDANADSGPLTVVRADGTGAPRQLGPVGFEPSWSPDGRTIAYATFPDALRDADRVRAHDITQIATVPATGGAGTVLARTRPSTTVRTVAEYPTWTPDSQSIVYDVFPYSPDGAFLPGELWAIDRRGQRAGVIATTSGDDVQAHTSGPAPASVIAGTASGYVPVTPRRLLDTRNGTGAPKAKVGERGVVGLQVRGAPTSAGPVPDTATAVVLNVTVTQTTASTDVRAYPSLTPVPGSSSLNAVGVGQTVPNLVTVQIGTDGRVNLRNNAGSAHLLADIAGFYTPGPDSLGFTSLAPTRVLDTRADSPVGVAPAKLGAGRALTLRVTGDLPKAGGGTVTVPADARAVVLNVTATRSTAASTFISAAPFGGPISGSNLNVLRGQSVPNLVTVAVGKDSAGVGKIVLRNEYGEVDLIADLAGYYSAGSTGRFVPVRPLRVVDTRTGVGVAPILTTAGAFVEPKLAGARGVPDNASAVVLNLTGTAASTGTFITAHPAGTTPPKVSNLNLVRSLPRANAAIVKLGTDGRITLRNSTGQLHLIGDLAGYMVG